MEQISVKEVKDKMANNEDFVLLDVREPEERADFNIGGEFIPLGNVMGMQVESLEDFKDKEVICYCRSGKRSMQAGMMLETMGFKHVKNLEGGMLAWQEANAAGNTK